MKTQGKEGLLRLVTKQYHEIFAIVLADTGQTQEQAAKTLGISLSYFNQIYRCKAVPDFRSKRGKVLADRLFRWTEGCSVEFLFPEKDFTKEFLRAPKTHFKAVSFEQMYGTRSRSLTFPTDFVPHLKTEAKVRRRLQRGKK